GRIWLVHLGMTGRLTLGPADTTPDRHDHVVVAFDDGRLLTYNDPRRFGRLAVMDSVAVAAETGAGLDPLAPAFPAEALAARTRPRPTPAASAARRRHSLPRRPRLDALPGAVHARRRAVRRRRAAGQAAAGAAEGGRRARPDPARQHPEDADSPHEPARPGEV